jgi:hypothetical protein
MAESAYILPEGNVQIAFSGGRTSAYILRQIIDALRACREFCSAVAVCFAITRAAYAYTGGMDGGVCVTLINYPRFPSSEPELADKAMRMGEHLREQLFQDSFAVEGPQETVWVSTRLDSRTEQSGGKSGGCEIAGS